MIVVTGGAGFIGANLVKALNARGRDDVLVVDDLTDGTKFVNLADCILGDYLDKEDFRMRVEAALRGEQSDLPPIEAIFHEGACSDTTEWDGKFMLENNFEYSKVLLHFCQYKRIPFLYASSAATYGGSEVFVEAPEHEILNGLPAVWSNRGVPVRARVEGTVVAVELVVRTLPGLDPVAEISMDKVSEQDGEQIFATSFLPPDREHYRFFLRFKTEEGVPFVHAASLQVAALLLDAQAPVLVYLNADYTPQERRALRADLDDGLAHDGIDLPGHDAGAGLGGGQPQFSKTAARSHGKQADVIGDLHHGDGDCLERSADGYRRILGGLRLEVISGLGEVDARFARELRGYHRAEGGPGVDPRSNRGASDGELPEVSEGVLEMGDAVLDLAGVSVEFLPESNRCCVHEMGAADLQDVPELSGFFSQRILEPAERGDEAQLRRLGGRHVDRGGEDIV